MYAAMQGHVYMCIWGHKYIYYTYVCIYINVCMYGCVCIYAISVYTFSYIHVYVCMHLDIYVCRQMSICMDINTHITYMHAITHVCI